MEMSRAGTRIFIQSERSSGGRARLGRPLGTVPTMLTPRSPRAKPQTATVVATRATAGPTFASVPAVRSASPRRTQERLQAAPRPEEEDERPEADRSGVGIGLAELAPELDDQLDERLALQVDPEHRPELTRGDLETRGGDEARDDRVAEEVREEAQPQQPHREQQEPGDQRERDGRAQVLRRPLGRQRGHGRCGHEADHRHGTDRKRARRAEDRVDHERRHRGEEPDLHRQPRQQGIGQRLRDQHDRDDHRHDQVVRERPAGVLGPPLQDREIAAEQAADAAPSAHACPPILLHRTSHADAQRSCDARGGPAHERVRNDSASHGHDERLAHMEGVQNEDLVGGIQDDGHEEDPADVLECGPGEPSTDSADR